MSAPTFLPIRNCSELAAAEARGASVFEIRRADKWEPFHGYLYVMAGAIERGHVDAQLRAVLDTKP